MVAAERPDVTLVDAPVAGGRESAQRGELTVFGSGPDWVRARLAALFDAVGGRTVWLGPVGAGSRVKLLHSAWVAFAAEAVATSVALAHRWGLDTRAVADAVADGSLVSPWQAARLERIAGGEFSAQVPLGLALHEVRLALQADGGDRFAALTGLAEEWQRAADEGLADQDLTVVTRALEQQPTR
jgi:3-hydroxyisobutyrate dehydrogenase